jgi:glycosyltransferase involved in cell wall biosynthesis
VEPLISVVVPAFNHQDLVEEALTSVLDQSWPELEVLVVDDASTDDTADRVEELLELPETRNRLRGRQWLHRQPANAGAHAAINLGVSRASGEWIAVLNSDDRYTPDRLSRMMGELDAGGGQLAFSGVQFIDVQGRESVTGDGATADLLNAQANLRSAPSIGFALLRRNVAVSTGNLLFRRSLYDRVGGFRPLAYCHDWDFTLRSLLLTEPRFIPAPLYEYRIHGTNSFRALGGVADQEAREVLRGYFALVRAGQDENPLAPTPARWPGVFEAMMDAMGHWEHWKTAERARVGPVLMPATEA